MGEAEALRAAGHAYHDQGRFSEAASAYRESLRSDENQPLVWSALGCAETSRAEYAAALTCFRHAVRLDPTWLEAQHNLGRVLFELGRTDEALRLFEAAIAGSRPDVSWNALAVVVPGGPESDNQRVLDVRRAWAAGTLPAPRSPDRFLNRDAAPGRRLRIGYLGAFFAYDNWMKPMWGLINRHDRERFEVHLFSDCPAARIEHGYRWDPRDRFHDITGLSNEAAADRVEASAIDVLIDLNGFSAPRRLPLVALRPAPVIVALFSMYATSGMDAYDYLIGDNEVIPPEEERFYSEKIVRVPGSYLTFDVEYPVPPVAGPPCLATGRIAFGSLASQYKITPPVIAAWSAILREVPDSVLVLRNSALSASSTCRFVHEQFEAHGIPAERVRLHGRADHYSFLQTYDEIDIALDTFPYSGGTTTTEALWQGVPVVTCRGDRWVARTSASLLRAANLSRFIADSIAGYVELAVALGSAPGTRAELAALRRDMRSQLRSAPVCDTRAFAKNLEDVFAGLVSRNTLVYTGQTS